MLHGQWGKCSEIKHVRLSLGRNYVAAANHIPALVLVKVRQNTRKATIPADHVRKVLGELQGSFRSIAVKVGPRNVRSDKDSDQHLCVLLSSNLRRHWLQIPSTCLQPHKPEVAVALWPRSRDPPDILQHGHQHDAILAQAKHVSFSAQQVVGPDLSGSADSPGHAPTAPHSLNSSMIAWHGSSITARHHTHD